MGELKVHLKILKSGSLLDKTCIIKVIKFFGKTIWHELFKFSLNRKVDTLQFFFKKGSGQEIKQNLPLIKLPALKSQNFLNTCMEEYISGRRQGLQLVCKNRIKAIFWNNVENFFENIMNNFENTKEPFSLVFLSIESNRFDKLKKICKKKNPLKKIYSLVSRYYMKFLPQSHRKFIDNILKKILKNEITCDKNQTKKKFYSDYIKHVFQNPFMISERQIKLASIKHLNRFSNLQFTNLRKTIHNLSISGLIGNDIFWIKKPKRVFQNLIMNIVIKKIKYEITTIKKTLKIETTVFNMRTTKHWNNQFKSKITSNFEKFAFLFGSLVLNTNNHGNLFFEDIMTFNKLSIWCKYLSGFAFSILNSNQKIFYRFLPKIIYKDSISDYLKGGLILGLSLDLKKNQELERVFYRQCLSILRSNELPIVKYGTCLSLASVISGKLINAEISDVRIELFRLVEKEKLLSDGASLALGILFLGSNSIYLLKYFLEMILQLNYRENSVIKTNLIFLITAISFIFCRNKGYCNYLYENLIEEKNPVLRQGGLIIFSLGNFRNSELCNVKTLLNQLSIENDDNVKFAIIQSIGFIFVSRYDLIKDILIQFVNHYNPFIKLGLCFAVTLSSFGIKNVEKPLNILQKLVQDKIDFVSQGACLCLGLLYFHSPSKKGLKKAINILKSVIIENRSKITKFGAILALSIIEIKQTNSFSDNLKIYKVPEFLVLFLQYWSWLPNLCFGIEFLSN